MARESPFCATVTSSPLEGKAKPSRLLGGWVRFPLKMALSNQSRTPETRKARSAAVDGCLPPLRQLDIDPPSLTLSLGRGAHVAAGVDPGPGDAARRRAERGRRVWDRDRDSRVRSPLGQVETARGDAPGRAAAGGRPPAHRAAPIPGPAAGARRLPVLKPPFPFIPPASSSFPPRPQQRSS